MCFHDAVVIEAMYRDMDRVLGKTLSYVDSSTVLYVLSDHGFTSFRRGVNLNTWLLREGYLTLLGDSIDWNRTRAYTFGLGGLYLNQCGREAEGVVSDDEAPALRREIAAKLTGLQDGQNLAILKAYESSDLYRGPYLGAAPDLIIGYADGYRASWDAAVGKVSAEIFEDNAKAWCGDHCVDPSLVPGILFSNRNINADDPGIEDMAPTALSLFGIAAPAWMEGKSVA